MPFHSMLAVLFYPEYIIYATPPPAVIYLDWIQNHLVLDPMQSYTP